MTTYFTDSAMKVAFERYAKLVFVRVTVFWGTFKDVFGFPKLLYNK